MAFAVSLIYNFVCTAYFDVGRSNILYSGCFFLAGGLIYLYRYELMKLNRWIGLGAVVISVVLYYILGGNTAGCLLISVCWLSYAVICVCGGGYYKEKLFIGKQDYKLCQRYQYGDISLPYGYLSCG